VTLGIGLRAGVLGELADTILTPDGGDLGALVLGNRLGIVVAESGDRGGEVGKKP